MSDQILLPMHTLNKYGIPCEDATAYADIQSRSGSGDVFYLQQSNNKSDYVVTQGLTSDDYIPPDPPEEEYPATGVPGFLYCDFYDNQVDYYSFLTGELLTTGSLPGIIVQNDDLNLDPAIHVDTGKLSANLDNHEFEYQRFEREDSGDFTEIGRENIWKEFPYSSAGYFGRLINTVSSSKDFDWHWNGLCLEDASGSVVASTHFTRDTSGILPCYAQDNFFTFNATECVTNDGGEVIRCLGILWKAYYPGLASSTDLLMFEKVNLLVGDVLNYTASDQWKDTWDSDLWYDIVIFDSNHIDININNYDYLWTYFDTLSGSWSPGQTSVNGSRTLLGRYFNNILYICITGNPEIWFNSYGQTLYQLQIPTGDYVSERVDYKYHFYYVVYTGGKSYVYKYDLNTGTKYTYEIPDIYSNEGYYKLLNRQVLGGKYLAVYTGSSHAILLDIDNLSGEIKYHVNFPISLSPGFHITSALKGYYGESGHNPFLLVLCNKLRTNKMMWSSLQEIVASNHAYWCAQHGKYQHEGPGDVDTVGTRCRAMGLYASVSENIMLVISSNTEKEQMDAFKGWCGSPHHYTNILRSANICMSFGCATYPASVTEIETGVGMFDPISKTYLSESQTIQIPEYLRGKVKIYVQNFIIEA